MIRNILILIILSLLVFIQSCQFFPFKKTSTSESDSQSQTNYRKIIKATQTGEIKEVPENEVDISSIEKAYLKKIGDRIDFERGVPFELNINIDPNTSTLKVGYDENTKWHYIEVIPINQKIKLTKKCEVIRVNAFEGIPIIEVDDSIQYQEQIVITPIFNTNCEFLGYEIRYGTTERGCKSKVLKQFINCTKAKVPPKNTKFDFRILFE